MTDEELCKDARLAAKCLKDTDTFPTGQGIFLDCADRIEALTKELDEANKRGDAWRFRADIAEVKLTKAVEGLRYYAVEAMPWEADDSLIARCALAEIKGEKG